MDDLKNLQRAQERLLQTRMARIKAAEAYTDACKAHEEAMEDYQDAVRTYCAARLKPAYDYDTGE